MDTNVLAVANGLAGQAGPQCVLACSRRLASIQRGEILVLDDARRIIGEYRRLASSTGQPGVGDAFLKWVMTNQANHRRCELVHLTTIEDDEREFEEFPDSTELHGFDRSDRKFVAVARASRHAPPILNATDTD